jgi:microcystin-dependent protein
VAFKVPKIFAAGTKAKADEVNENFAAIEKEINQSLVPGLFEPGDLKITARANPPEGWLVCDGAAVSRTTYSDLFAAIGTIYGAGDGATTFNLPDLRGRVPVTADGSAGRLNNSPDALGQSGGHEKLQSHSHGAGGLGLGPDTPNHAHNLGWHASTRHEGSGFDYPGVIAGGNTPTSGVTANHTHVISGNTASEGSGNGHNMQPYLVVNTIVKI